MSRSRQQWAIGLTGIGAMLVASVFIFGGPSFDFECSGNECGEQFTQFVFWVAWSFFAMSFGSIALIVGVVLFILDGTQRPPEESAED